MTSRCSRLTGLEAVLLFAASTQPLAQDDDEHSVHHPEAQAAEGAPPAAEPAPPAGMMEEGMMREWGITRDGKTDVENKDKTKVRMGRSPDLFDSLVVAIEAESMAAACRPHWASVAAAAYAVQIAR